MQGQDEMETDDRRSSQKKKTPLQFSLRTRTKNLEHFFSFADGESNESDGAFNLSNFWDTLSWVSWSLAAVSAPRLLNILWQLDDVHVSLQWMFCEKCICIVFIMFLQWLIWYLKKKKKRKEALGEFLPSWSCYMMQLSVSTDQAVKAVSQEATKLSLAFSKPPLPSQQVILFL